MNSAKLCFLIFEAFLAIFMHFDAFLFVNQWIREWYLASQYNIVLCFFVLFDLL